MASKETQNFYRLTSLILEVSLDILRETIIQELAGVSFESFVMSKKHEIYHCLLKRSCCTQGCSIQAQGRNAESPWQWNTLFESNGINCSRPNCRRSSKCILGYQAKRGISEKDIDISLAALLLTEIFKVDENLIRRIKALRKLRNEEYAHSINNAKIPDTEFEKIWQKAVYNILCLSEGLPQTRLYDTFADRIINCRCQDLQPEAHMESIEKIKEQKRHEAALLNIEQKMEKMYLMMERLYLPSTRHQTEGQSSYVRRGFSSVDMPDISTDLDILPTMHNSHLVTTEDVGEVLTRKNRRERGTFFNTLVKELPDAARKIVRSFRDRAMQVKSNETDKITNHIYFDNGVPAEPPSNGDLPGIIVQANVESSNKDNIEERLSNTLSTDPEMVNRLLADIDAELNSTERRCIIIKLKPRQHTTYRKLQDAFLSCKLRQILRDILLQSEVGEDGKMFVSISLDNKDILKDMFWEHEDYILQELCPQPVTLYLYKHGHFNQREFELVMIGDHYDRRAQVHQLVNILRTKPNACELFSEGVSETLQGYIMDHIRAKTAELKSQATKHIPPTKVELEESKPKLALQKDLLLPNFLLPKPTKTLPMKGEKLKDDMICYNHGQHYEGFCNTCSFNVCPVCILFDHCLHDVNQRSTQPSEHDRSTTGDSKAIESRQTYCRNHEYDAVTIVFCTDCQESICWHCLVNIHISHKTVLHKNMVKKYCRNHQEKQCDRFCETCNYPICDLCFSKEHQTHDISLKAMIHNVQKHHWCRQHNKLCNLVCTSCDNELLCDTCIPSHQDHLVESPDIVAKDLIGATYRRLLKEGEDRMVPYIIKQIIELGTVYKKNAQYSGKQLNKAGVRMEKLQKQINTRIEAIHKYVYSFLGKQSENFLDLRENLMFFLNRFQSFEEQLTGIITLNDPFDIIASERDVIGLWSELDAISSKPLQYEQIGMQHRLLSDKEVDEIVGYVSHCDQMC